MICWFICFLVQSCRLPLPRARANKHATIKLYVLPSTHWLASSALLQVSGTGSSFAKVCVVSAESSATIPFLQSKLNVYKTVYIYTASVASKISVYGISTTIITQLIVGHCDKTIFVIVLCNIFFSCVRAPVSVTALSSPFLKFLSKLG